MNLHHPSRPRIFHRPAFTSGYHVVPRLQIWPLGREEEESYSHCEISLMLPVKDTRFAGAWKSARVNIADLPDLVRNFRDDPEQFVLSHFNLDITKINSSSPANGGEHSSRSAKENPSESIATPLSVTELLGE